MITDAGQGGRMGALLPGASLTARARGCPATAGLRLQQPAAETAEEAEPSCSTRGDGRGKGAMTRGRRGDGGGEGGRRWARGERDGEGAETLAHWRGEVRGRQSSLPPCFCPQSG